jgi:hypothetical protein
MRHPQQSPAVEKVVVVPLVQLAVDKVKFVGDALVFRCCVPSALVR